jgi:nucleotide-binding universal stress UspA family protein
MEQDASSAILLHVMDEHLVADGFAGLMGMSPATLQETQEEGSALLRFAEATLAAEYEAVNRTAPAIVQRIAQGKPGSTIAQIATEAGATAIILGARRPHALGRLAHPDVVDFLRRHTAIPVHVISLQAETPQSTTQ